MIQYPLLSEIAKQNSPSIDLEEFKDKDLVEELQHLLNEKGFNAGKVDGIAGEQTLEALENAKDYLFLQYPTLIGKTTIDRLFAFNSLNSGLFLPTNGIGVVTSPFNPQRKHPITGKVRPHRGIDIGANQGTPIYALADGLISLAVTGCIEGNRTCGGGFGNHLRISHIGVFSLTETVYAHLETVSVKTGQHVKKGQIIGTLGNTGSSNGPHLHFETWHNGIAINPMQIFNSIV